MAMKWTPSNEPARYDPKRVAEFRRVTEAVDKLGLPLIRFRKLRTIYNAIEMQIEDGGDSPEVNELLLDALRAAVIHQVGEQAAVPVLRAIESFRGREAKRWEQIQSGTPPLGPEAEEDSHAHTGFTRPRIASADASSGAPPPPARAAPKLGRNDPCWCGSGKKYKRCHLPADQA